MLAALLWTLAFNAGPAPSQPSLAGYSKTFVVTLWPPAVAGAPPPAREWSLHDALRLKFAWALNDGLSFNLAYGLVPQVRNPTAGFGLSAGSRRYRIDDVRPRIYPWYQWDSGHFTLGHNLDRAYVRLSRGPVDHFIGRQAVAWGSARIVNPTDVVAPYPFTELDAEERVGVDALRAVLQLGGLSFAEAGVVSGRNFHADSSAAYIRIKTHWAMTDIAPVIVLYRGHLMAGMDLAGSMGGAGVWLEAAYTRYRLGEKNLADIRYSWRVTSGCDFRLSQSIYSFIEYHFNGDGENDPAFYRQNSVKPGFRDGPVYLMGRHYLIPSLAWQIHPLLNSSTMPLVNLGDLSCILSQSLEFNVTQDSYLSAGAYAPFGGNDVRPSSGYPPALSEFGSYPLVLFLSYGCYF